MRNELEEIIKNELINFNGKVAAYANDLNGSGILPYLTIGLELSVKDIATLMMIISDNADKTIIKELIKGSYNGVF